MGVYTEQDFVSDIIACVHARYLGMRHGWPNYQLLGRVLDDWNCRLSVTFADLYKTGLFRNTNGVAKFVEFYAKYDFCEPPRVSKVGVVMNEEKEQEHKEMQELIINCLHKYFKGKAPGLKEVANQGISFAEKRRQDRNAQSPTRNPPNEAEDQLQDVTSIVDSALGGTSNGLDAGWKAQDGQDGQ